MTFLAISLFFKNLFGWMYINWRLCLTIFCIAVTLIAVIVLFRGCGKKEIKLDSKAIQQAQQAIAEQDRKTMVEILTKSDLDEKIADGIVANSSAETVNAIKESKDKWSQATTDEMAAELEKRAAQR